MPLYEQMKLKRRIVGGTAGLVIALVVGLMAGAVLSDDGPGLLQAIATVAAFTLPAWFAFISLDRRPSLLPAAGMAALVMGFAALELIPLWLIVAIVWGLVARSRIRPAPEPRWARFGRPLLAIAAVVPVLVLFAHLDPACTVTYADGRTEQVDPAERGLESGWQLRPVGSSSSSTSERETMREECASDTVVWWEAASSLGASAVVVAMALRWPTGESLVADRQRSTVPA
ncbi:MAG: hypothetical protein P1T08_14900 [Acidimicrobiia bacterium]|nr:hypothetical protein [Acidimicrobiia bacterium]